MAASASHMPTPIRRRSIPEKPKKNPRLAAALSVVLPGLGQMYNHEVSKGLGFFAAAAFMVLIIVGGFNQSLARPGGYSELERAFGAQVWSNQDLLFAVGPFLLGFIVWSAVDAFNTARGPQ